MANYDAGSVANKSKRSARIFSDLNLDFQQTTATKDIQKIEAVEAYSSQFFDSSSEEPTTPISTENFKESISYRAKNFGRLIGTEAGEGFTSSQPLSISDLNVLIRS